MSLGTSYFVLFKGRKRDSKKKLSQMSLGTSYIVNRTLLKTLDRKTVIPSPDEHDIS